MKKFFKKMDPMQRLFWGMIGIGLGMGVIFPFYANAFVEWIPGRKVFFILGCLIAGLLVGLLNYYIMKKVLGYVIERSFEKVKNNLGENIIQARSTDEFGTEHFTILDNIFEEIGTVFKRIYNNQENLQKLMLNCKKNIESLNENTNEVAAASQEVSASIEDVATVIENLASHSSSIVDAAQDTYRQLEHNKEQVDMGKNSLNETIESMAELNNDINQIDTILATIQKITEQTDMLALNAAVEAVKSKGNSDGFKVVADEIKKLAERSNTANKKIQELLMIIHQSSQKVNKILIGKQISKNNIQLSECSSNKSVNQVFTTIDQSSQQCLSAINEVLKVAEEQAVNTEEVSASTQEISATIEQVASSIQSVSHITQELVQHINKTALNSEELTNYIEEKVG